MLAVMKDQVDMVDFLIKSHADVQKSAPLHRSALFYVNVADTTKLLIKAGASVNHKDDDSVLSLLIKCLYILLLAED